jgi:hypothetical protein
VSASIGTVAPPSLDETRAWIGYQVGDLAGEALGSADGLFVDAASHEPTWLVVKSKRGRFASSHVVVPVADCAGAGGSVWVAHGRGVIRSAPIVDPRRPLLREHELAICAHYGIGERVGRAAALVARPEGWITSQPGP